MFTIPYAIRSLFPKTKKSMQFMQVKPCNAFKLNPLIGLGFPYYNKQHTKRCSSDFHVTSVLHLLSYSTNTRARLACITHAGLPEPYASEHAMLWLHWPQHLFKSVITFLVWYCGVLGWAPSVEVLGNLSNTCKTRTSRPVAAYWQLPPYTGCRSPPSQDPHAVLSRNDPCKLQQTEWHREYT